MSWPVLLVCVVSEVVSRATKTSEIASITPGSARASLDPSRRRARRRPRSYPRRRPRRHRHLRLSLRRPWAANHPATRPAC
eukprot:scaffold100167_cov65-Phaeocystis_antarctica.AAC.4